MRATCGTATQLYSVHAAEPADRLSAVARRTPRRSIWPSVCRRLRAAAESGPMPPSPSPPAPPCRACRRKAERRRCIRPRPPSWPSPTGTRCRYRPAFRGRRSPATPASTCRARRRSCNPGDAFLIVGDERAGSLATGSPSDPTKNNWDVRIVSSVKPDAANGRTLVTWSEGLGGSGVPPAQVNPRFYALRQRAALFGYNAISPIMLSSDVLDSLYWADLLNGNWPPDWSFGWDDVTGATLASEGLVDLDNVYSKLVPGGWVALIRPTSDHSRTPAGFVSLFAIKSITTVSRSDYSLSAKITRVLTDSSSATESQLDADYNATRTVSVLAQSELLPAIEQPLDYPLYGTVIDLETVRNDLAAIQAVAVTGSNPQLMVNSGVTVNFDPYDGSGQVALGPGAMLTLMQPPPTVFNTDGSIPDWRGLDRRGLAGRE